MTRADRRDETRQRIVAAAIEAFAEQGYAAAGTRDIAARAGVTQGLITYHFESKELLWRAAADQLFSALGGELEAGAGRVSAAERLERAREGIRTYVRFGAAHPEVFHFMVDAGKHDDDRMRWLVDTHLQSRFAGVAEVARVAFPRSGPELIAHVHYALVGAASLMFAVAPECAALTGVDPVVDEAVERHADLIARLFVPD